MQVVLVAVDADGEFAGVARRLVDADAGAPGGRVDTSAPRSNWLRASSPPRVGSFHAAAVAPVMFSNIPISGFT